MSAADFRVQADALARKVSAQHGAIEDAVYQKPRRIRYFFADGTAVDVTAAPSGKLRHEVVQQ